MLGPSRLRFPQGGEIGFIDLHEEVFRLRGIADERHQKGEGDRMAAFGNRLTYDLFGPEGAATQPVFEASAAPEIREEAYLALGRLGVRQMAAVQNLLKDGHVRPIRLALGLLAAYQVFQREEAKLVTAVGATLLALLRFGEAR